MDKNVKAIYILAAVIIVIMLLLFLLKVRQDLAGKATGPQITPSLGCGGIFPDPTQIPQALSTEVAVFTIQPNQDITKITGVQGNAALNIHFYGGANLFTLKPAANTIITINCLRDNNGVPMMDKSEFTLQLV